MVFKSPLGDRRKRGPSKWHKRRTNAWDIPPQWKMPHAMKQQGRKKMKRTEIRGSAQSKNSGNKERGHGKGKTQ